MPRPPENRTRIVAYVSKETAAKLEQETNKTVPERNTPGKVIDRWAEKSKAKKEKR